MRASLFGHDRRRRASAGLSLVCLAALLALLMAPSVSADDPGAAGGQPTGAFSLLQPMSNSLSAASWMMVNGYDPRLLSGSPERNPSTGAINVLAPSQGHSTGAGPAAAPLVPFRNPAPSFSRNILITKNLGYTPIQTEPSIAVDPKNPQHLVLGEIDYNFPSMIAYVSMDGGQTWDGPHQIRYFDEDLSSAGDPCVSFGRDGTVYISSISVGLQEYTIGPIVSETEVSSMVVARSTDGGYTWSDGVSAARSTVVTHPQTDSTGKQRGTIVSGFLDKPWLTVGPSKSNPSKDALYLSYTDFETTSSIIYADEVPFLTSPSTEATIKVVSSTDGGLTWSQPVAVSPTVVQVAGASEPGIGGGDSGQGAGLTALVGAQQSATGLHGAQAWNAAQTDPAPAAPNPETQQASLQIGANRTVQGSQPKVMKDGTVVVAYLDTTNDGVQDGLDAIMVTKSSDGGKTWTPPTTAGVFIEPHFTPRNSFFRYWGSAFPQLALGPDQQVYILTTGLPPDRPTDDGVIYFMRSLDGGKTWQAPKAIDPPQNDRLQFFPSIAVAPDGSLHVMWGDMRDDPNEVRYNIYYTQSTDQGTTWGFPSPEQHITLPDTRVSDFASNSLKGFPDGLFLGDYFSIAATTGNVYLVWADTRLGEYNGFSQQIAFARETSMPSPQLFLNPASGTAGREVTIQGFTFQPDSQVVITVGGVNYANVLTDDTGNFTTDVFMPITGEGAQQVQAFDASGNVATTSFYTSFGFDTIQKTLSQLGAATPSALPPSTPATVASPSASPVAPPPFASPVAPPPFASPGASAPTASGPLVAGVSSLSDLALFGLGGFAFAAVAYGGITRRRWWRRRS